MEAWKPLFDAACKVEIGKLHDQFAKLGTQEADQNRAAADDTEFLQCETDVQTKETKDKLAQLNAALIQNGAAKFVDAQKAELQDVLQGLNFDALSNNKNLVAFQVAILAGGATAIANTSALIQLAQAPAPQAATPTPAPAQTATAINLDAYNAAIAQQCEIEMGKLKDAFTKQGTQIAGGGGNAADSETLDCTDIADLGLFKTEFENTNNNLAQKGKDKVVADLKAEMQKSSKDLYSTPVMQKKEVTSDEIDEAALEVLGIVYDAAVLQLLDPQSQGTRPSLPPHAAAPTAPAPTAPTLNFDTWKPLFEAKCEQDIQTMRARLTSTNIVTDTGEPAGNAKDLQCILAHEDVIRSAAPNINAYIAKYGVDQYVTWLEGNMQENMAKNNYGGLLRMQKLPQGGTYALAVSVTDIAGVNAIEEVLTGKEHDHAPPPAPAAPAAPAPAPAAANGPLTFEAWSKEFSDDCDLSFGLMKGMFTAGGKTMSDNGQAAGDAPELACQTDVVSKFYQGAIPGDNAWIASNGAAGYPAMKNQQMKDLEAKYNFNALSHQKTFSRQDMINFSYVMSFGIGSKAASKLVVPGK